MTQKNKNQTLHFVGIKGVAMTALAVYAKEYGYTVSGSDVNDQFPTDEILDQANIVPQIGFDPLHVEPSTDLVVYTGAHSGRENIEVKTALSKGITSHAHGKALGLFMEKHRQISVAGCHGKTTTTAMIAMLLMEAGLDPSYAVGCGEIRGLGKSGHYGKGQWFVAEADEYVTDPHHDLTPRYYWQDPEIFVITNIDYDHPDVYKNIQDVQDKFLTFVQSKKNIKYLILNASDKNSQIFEQCGVRILRFGNADTSSLKPENIHIGKEKTTFDLRYHGNIVENFELHVPGEHNVLNASAAALAAHAIGIDWDTIRKGLSKFRGTKRRFEKLAEKKNVIFFDDYAHHPKEIQATLLAARSWYKDNRILVVFQPHTYSRTIAMLDEFSKAFLQANIVCIAGIYASAREQIQHNFSSANLVKKIKTNQNDVYLTSTSEDIVSTLKMILKKGDIVLFMGAGDIYNWEKDIIASLYG